MKRGISCHFPSGRSVSFPSGRITSFFLLKDSILFLSEDHILFPQVETVSFFLRENCIVFPLGGSHAFPPGRMYPLLSGTLLFLNLSIGQSWKVMLSWSFPDVSQGDLLPHVVSMTTHGLTNLRTKSPVPSSFLSICFSLMFQWLLRYNRKVSLFLF